MVEGMRRGRLTVGQVRCIVKTAAIHDWLMASTDIRVAFLNAPRRDDGKVVVMEVPRVFRLLGLAEEGDQWVIDLAMYGRDVATGLDAA